MFNSGMQVSTKSHRVSTIGTMESGRAKWRSCDASGRRGNSRTGVKTQEAGEGELNGTYGNWLDKISCPYNNSRRTEAVVYRAAVLPVYVFLRDPVYLLFAICWVVRCRQNPAFYLVGGPASSQNQTVD
jgi:hypothetical protein